jgi:hypothetical protein
MHGEFRLSNIITIFKSANITIFKYINTKIEQKSRTFFYKECIVLLYHRSVKWRKDSISYLDKNTEMSELAARRATKAISETEELSPKEAQTTHFQFKPKSFTVWNFTGLDEACCPRWDNIIRFACWHHGANITQCIMYLRLMMKMQTLHL